MARSVSARTTSPPDPRLAEELRAARQERGLTIRELAAELGVSPATVSAMENARTGLNRERLGRIAAALSTTVEALQGGGVAEAVAGGIPMAEPLDWRRYPPLTLGQPLAAALEAFLRYGYHGATVREIATRAGLSVPGVYHYHPSKHDMLVALLRFTMDDLLARARAAREEGGDPVERFGLLVEHLVLFHTHRRQLGFIATSEMRSLEPAARVEVGATIRAHQAMLADELAEAVRAGMSQAPRPAEAARAVASMCTALPQWFRDDGPDTPEELAKRYVEFALDLTRCRRPSRQSMLTVAARRR